MFRSSAGIDTFENHSCDPNTDSVWVEGSLTKYLCVATKPIRVGDEITCVQTGIALLRALRYLTTALFL